MQGDARPRRRVYVRAVIPGKFNVVIDSAWGGVGSIPEVMRAREDEMADVQARVVTGADGQVSLYLFSNEKTPGGASLRYASLSVEDGEMLLMIATRSPEETDIVNVSATTLGTAMLRAFAHVQR